MPDELTLTRIPFGTGRIAIYVLDDPEIDFCGLILRDQRLPGTIGRIGIADDFRYQTGDILLDFARVESVRTMIVTLESLIALVEERQKSRTPHENNESVA